MLKPRQPVAPLQILPAFLFYLIALASGQVPRVFAMPTAPAVAVYSLQVILAVGVYFGLLLGNRFDLSRLLLKLWDGQLSTTWSLVIFSYLIFLARVSLLSAFETGSLFLILSRCGYAIPDRTSGTGFWFIIVFVIFMAIHTILEHRRLGRNAWYTDEAKHVGDNMSGCTDKHTWLRKNLKWIVTGACVLCIVIFTTVQLGLKSSWAYSESLRLALGDQTVVAELGEPVEPGWFVTGSMKVSGPTGEADLAIPLIGEQKTGTLYVTAQKHVGNWQFDRVEFQVSGSKKRIALTLSK